MNVTDPKQLAQQLQAATRAGDLAAAYVVLKSLDFETVRQVAMHGGYSLIFTKKRKELLEHLQPQIAKASRLRGDGWLLGEGRAA
jgi:hypothetical protein